LTQNSHWNPGDQILLRGIWLEKIWFAIVAYVVQDTEDLIALYWHAGTPNKIPGFRLTGQDFLVEQQPSLISSTWTRTNLLTLVKPGAAHSVEVMKDAKTGEFLCWYINLQEPYRRTPLGFDTMDLALDVVISPDRSRWRWKDENEFAELIELGLISEPEAQAIRKEGLRVIQLSDQNQPPFCSGWESWSPPDEWSIPQFPENWHQIRFEEN
jgi:hypothetical protein